MQVPITDAEGKQIYNEDGPMYKSMGGLDNATASMLVSEFFPYTMKPPKPPSEKFTPSKRAKHAPGGGGYAGGNRTKRQYKKRKTQRRVRSKK